MCSSRVCHCCSVSYAHFLDIDNKGQKRVAIIPFVKSTNVEQVARHLGLQALQAVLQRSQFLQRLVALRALHVKDHLHMSLMTGEFHAYAAESI